MQNVLWALSISIKAETAPPPPPIPHWEFDSLLLEGNYSLCSSWSIQSPHGIRWVMRQMQISHSTHGLVSKL